MAEVILTGFDELQDAFKAIGSIPYSITRRAVDAMGDVAVEKVNETGRAMGVWDPNPKNTDHVLNHTTHSKPMKTDDGGKAFITFKGSRVRGNTRTRNAAIAFMNEFGVAKHGIPARPFIMIAMNRFEEEIAAPADEIIGGWIEKTYSK